MENNKKKRRKQLTSSLSLHMFDRICRGSYLGQWEVRNREPIIKDEIIFVIFFGPSIPVSVLFT